MKIEKNFFEKLGEGIRKRKQDNKRATEKYWKLPATERLHYDSIQDRIEGNRIRLLFSTIYSMRLMFYLLVGFVFLGFFTGNLTELMVAYLKVLQNYFNFFIIFPIMDIIFTGYLFNKRKEGYIKLNKRFKLIK